MSMLPQRERVAIPERKAMTLAREVAILRRHVFCADCGKQMTDRSQYVYDHEIPWRSAAETSRTTCVRSATTATSRKPQLTRA
ncbi:MAG TPA: hypothetical protein K8W01_00425 [Methylorubrum populi]|uniref:HNH endonuclease n=1 Tax=Methylorubrum populi TaxID=223967 RepID=A0A921E075_9HYPH|nr:hypothetical protein [Methylorubrum populi]